MPRRPCSPLWPKPDRQVTNTPSHSRDAVRPSFYPVGFALSFRGRRECRAPDAPAATCAMGRVEGTRVSQVTPESPGIPYAMVYGLLRALLGDRAFLPPSPLRSLLLKNLTPASGRRDHTTSPSASRTVRQRRIRVHRIPPRVRDDREPPLMWDGMQRTYQ